MYFLCAFSICAISRLLQTHRDSHLFLVAGAHIAWFASGPWSGPYKHTPVSLIDTRRHRRSLSRDAGYPQILSDKTGPSTPVGSCFWLEKMARMKAKADARIAVVLTLLSEALFSEQRLISGVHRTRKGVIVRLTAIYVMYWSDIAPEGVLWCWISSQVRCGRRHEAASQ